MVGKVVARRRLHQAAPHLATRRRGLPEEDVPATAVALGTPFMQGCLPSNIFAGVKIDPKTLVNKLDTDSRGVVSIIKGEEEKTLLSKKEKMKLRKEKWLQKIEGIKLAKQQQQAEAKRKATPVIGDLHPLMEALPELSDLVTVSKFCQQPKIQIKKMVLANFNQMKPAQKRKVLEEEITQFHKTILDPSFKANPLTVIGEHLSKILKQEREGKPL
ncbi:ribosome biogenesis protein SLX9 homolog isoform X1 [Tiliqua scincoides]|uniref:ribosome biogenesis protein SLX9 homolog isoform X1 n=1 Tax=Tiliqua scincoides TaxID=71010 RepID=UPI003461C672